MYENMFFMTSMKKVLERIREKNKDAAMQLLTGVKTTNQESVDWCLEHQASLDAYYITEKLASLFNERLNHKKKIPPRPHGEGNSFERR